MTRPQRRAALVVLAAVLVSLLGADPASAAPRDHVLAGRVLGNAGEPIAGASVVLDEGSGFFGAFLDALGCVLSWGTDRQLCGAHSATARTDGAGRYRLVLPHGSPVAAPGIRYLHVKGRGSRIPTFDGSTSVLAATGRLPDVVLWTRTARFERNDGRIVVARTPPQGSAGTTLDLRGDDPGYAAAAWYLRFDKNGRADVDERVFEDGVVSLQGTAAGRWSGRSASWVSAATAVPHVGRPSSRGLACSTYQEGGALVDYPGCPFTDGHLATQLSLQQAVALERQTRMCLDSDRCPSPNTIVLDLGSVRLPRAVVLRGCECDVELSLDGSVWLPWQDEQREGQFFEVHTGMPQPTRYVRVRGNVFLTWHLQEVSVWSDPLLVVPPAQPRPSAIADISPQRLPRPAVTELPVLLRPRT